MRDKKMIRLWIGLIFIVFPFSLYAAEPKVVYPAKSSFEFDGLKIQGEVRNPGEFYFRHKPEEKFDSLVKRRTEFHREMLRDVVMSR
jgi:hypothetical protein